jgi:hypothetical protein
MINKKNRDMETGSASELATGLNRAGYQVLGVSADREDDTCVTMLLLRHSRSRSKRTCILIGIFPAEKLGSDNSYSATSASHDLGKSALGRAEVIQCGTDLY